MSEERDASSKQNAAKVRASPKKSSATTTTMAGEPKSFVRDLIKRFKQLANDASRSGSEAPLVVAVEKSVVSEGESDGAVSGDEALPMQRFVKKENKDEFHVDIITWKEFMESLNENELKEPVKKPVPKWLWFMKC